MLLLINWFLFSWIFFLVFWSLGGVVVYTDLHKAIYPLDFH